MSQRIAMSSTGEYQCMIDRKNLWTSKNYGNTWDCFDFYGIPAFTPKSAAISADGKYQTFVDTNSVVRSEDHGKTWNIVEIDCVMGVWEDVALSASGQYQVAVVSCTYLRPTEPNTIWVSTDYGKTFNEAFVGGDLNGVCVSVSGEYQTAVSKNGGVCISSNYGETWTSLPHSDVQWKECDISADGRFQTLVGNRWVVDKCANKYVGIVSRTEDYGVTWSTMDVSDIIQEANSVCMSKSGKYQTVVTNDFIWISDSYGVEGSWKKFTNDKTRKTTRYTSCAMSDYGIYQVIVGPRDQSPYFGIIELLPQNYSRTE